MRNAPFITGLRALDAVLRQGSLSAAARELGVTPAAISHRLRELEAEAATPLVWRSGGRFVPTDAGVQVQAALGDAFARIRAADAAVRNLTAAPILRVVAPMSFTVLWLLPRLSAFEAAYPDVTPYVSAANDPQRRDGDQPDIRIVHGTDAPASGSWQLLVEDVTVVAFAPGSEAEGVTDPQRLLGFRAVHIDSPGGQRVGTLSWGDWAKAKGFPGAAPRGPHVHAEHAAADIAVQGAAVMLASLFTVAGHIATGRLKAVSGSAVRAGISYWISVERPGPTAQSFVDWLRTEVAAHQAGDMAVGLAQAGLA